MPLQPLIVAKSCDIIATVRRFAHTNILRQASNHIFKESKEHLTEIYEQINSSMSQTIESNRKLLNGWNQYIDNSVNIINGSSAGYDDADRAARREEFGSFMKQQKQLWGFTDFYFIGNEHTAETAGEDEFNNVVEVKRIDSEPINIRTRRKIQNLIAADEGGVVAQIGRQRIQKHNRRIRVLCDWHKLQFPRHEQRSRH